MINPRRDYQTILYLQHFTYGHAVLSIYIAGIFHKYAVIISYKSCGLISQRRQPLKRILPP